LNRLDKLAQKLKKRDLKREEFNNLLLALYGMFEDPALLYETLKARGFPIEEREEIVVLKTAKTHYMEQEYVIVDIETSGSKPANSQIIEIGAIKYRENRIVDRFESFVYASQLPEYITKLTGITPEDLLEAPPQREVLARFREFLGDGVFVAHNVGFDYGFLSDKLEESGYGRLANRKLCTIDLAKRTIKSQRYGLRFLNDLLGLDSLIHHRAYADALTALKVLKISMERLPAEVVSAEDLIDFSKKRKS